MKSKIQSYIGRPMSVYGLSLSKIVDVCNHTVDYDY